MIEDERCCGTGTCIINDEGYCWCGQKWDGQKMCFPERPAPAGLEPVADAGAAAADAPRRQGEA